MDITKDTLLKKADALLAEARRARKLSADQPAGAERDKLIHDAEQFESQAARLEKDAISARNGVFAGLPKPGAPRS